MTGTGGGGGSFWYGDYGFLYKRKGGGGGRKNPRYGLICNQPQNVWNKYQAGNNGVGGLNTSVRRAKNRLATVCEYGKCGSFYNSLGLYNAYLYNPNGYVPIQINNK